MYGPKRVPRMATIAGLIFEGFGLVAIIIGAGVIAVLIGRGSGFFVQQGLTQSEAELVMLVLSVLLVVLGVLAFVVLVFFLVNLYLFTRLLAGRFTVGQAKNVHLYQAIWGGVNILFNQIAGVLYLVSGLTGWTEATSETDAKRGA